MSEPLIPIKISSLPKITTSVSPHDELIVNHRVGGVMVTSRVELQILGGGVGGVPPDVRDYVDTGDALIEQLLAQAWADFRTAIARANLLQAQVKGDLDKVVAQVDTAINASVSNLRALIGTSASGIQAVIASQSRTIVDLSQAMATSLSGMIADFRSGQNTAMALIVLEQTVRSAADSATATVVTALRSEFHTATSAAASQIGTLSQTIATAFGTSATLITDLKSSFTTAAGQLNARITLANSTSASATESMAQQIIGLQSSFTSGQVATNAYLITEFTTRSTVDGSMAQQITALNTNFDNANVAANARITTEQLIRSSADSSAASTLSVVQASFQTATTATNVAIVDTRSALSDATKATGTILQGVLAQFDSANAATRASFINEQVVRATADSANSTSITQLSATVGTINATVTTYGSAIANLDGYAAAVWGFNVTAGNTVTGMRAISDTAGNSEIIFQADRVKFYSSGGGQAASGLRMLDITAISPASCTPSNVSASAQASDGSVTLTFSWTWGGSSTSISGFEVLVYTQSASTPSHTFGAGVAAGEHAFYVGPDVTAVNLTGMPADGFYWLGVRPYRLLDKSVSASGILRGTVATAGNSPYQPASVAVFSGGIGSSGVLASTVGTATTNFNNRNDQNGTAVTAPTGAAFSSTQATDGSANTAIGWSWGGTEADIDGFEIIVYQNASTTSPGSYTFGTSLNLEHTYVVPASKRYVMLRGVGADLWYKARVVAYRTVDPNVNASGIIRSSVNDSSLHQPSSTVNFGGNVTGSVGGTPATVINSWQSTTGDTTTIEGGKIRTGSIDANRIKADTAVITRLYIDTGGIMQSTGFNGSSSGGALTGAGTTGWAVSYNGDVAFNNILRATMYGPLFVDAPTGTLRSTSWNGTYNFTTGITAVGTNGFIIGNVGAVLRGHVYITGGRLFATIDGTESTLQNLPASSITSGTFGNNLMGTNGGLSGSNMDCNAYTHFTISATATTYTLINFAEGTTVTARVYNGGGTPTFAHGSLSILWAGGGGQPTQDAGSNAIYTFVNSGDAIFAVMTQF